MLVQANITIDGVYPWGRSFEEYVAMFALSDRDLKSRILSCADGPAAFNCELTRRGGSVVSCDPLYRFTTGQIRGRIRQTRHLLKQHAEQNAHLFCWDLIRSPQEMARIRMRAMDEFLADYPTGSAAGRYLDQSLPNLDFPDQAFDLAICSHFLFLYSNDFTLDFHLDAILEMCRVAREVKVFPLLDMEAQKSVHLEAAMAALTVAGYEPQVVVVPYEFQRGGNQMLRIIGKRNQWTRNLTHFCSIFRAS